MPIPPQKFREIVFQLLYSKDLADTPLEKTSALLMKELSITKKTAQTSLKRVQTIMSHLIKIDQFIRETSTSYRFERIQTVERNVLRLGIYELLYDEAIPAKVAIAEAMRLARKFGSPEAANFVNALLDAIYQSSIGKNHDLNPLETSALELERSEEIAKNAMEKKSLASQDET